MSRSSGRTSWPRADTAKSACSSSSRWSARATPSRSATPAAPRASASSPRRPSPRRRKTSASAVRALHEAKVQAIVHCGFGFGIVFVNPALQELGWDPPRFLGTAFQNAWINPIMWNAILGWTGLDQYDEGNRLGQEFLDRFAARYGRRPEYCVPRGEPRHRHRAAPRLCRCPTAVAPRGQGSARASEDAPGGIRRTRDPHLLREVDATRAGWAPATWWRDGSTRTARAPTSSPASDRTDAKPRGIVARPYGPA